MLLRKLIIYIAVLNFLQLSFTFTKTNEPLLVAVVMIKNEEPVIRETLDPLVKSGIDSFYILDTGSTDNTINVVKNYFKEKNIKNAFVGQDTFIDFAYSRNKALEFAEKKFPNATFMLMLDAEWHLCNGQDLIEFCRQKKDSDEHSYLIEIKNSRMNFFVQRLFRCKAHIRYEGVVHESPPIGTRHKVPQPVYFDLKNTRFGIEKTLARVKNRDIPMLLKSYKENPNNSRTVFYLAQSYECCADWQNAHNYYKCRLQLKGWDEENFMAMYKLGYATEHLSEINGLEAWPQALNYYLQAYSMRPNRIEPLIKIAQYYLRKNNYPLCFLYARRACEIPYPQNDILFIEKAIYDFTRWEILSICSWYVGEFKIGKEAVLNALKTKPNLQQLKNNLALYESKTQ